MEMKVQGIKCDNPECDYKDMSVKYEDYHEWLNRPCPKCGWNLLTQADYDTTNLLMKISKSKFLNFIEKVASIFGKKVSYYRLYMNGSGNFDYTETTKESMEQSFREAGGE